MKKIQLALLAVVMVISAAGAYANYHSFSDVYNIVPNTLPTSTGYQVAANPPAAGCGGSASYVCTVIASSGYSPGQTIPASQCTIWTLYN